MENGFAQECKVKTIQFLSRSITHKNKHSNGQKPEKLSITEIQYNYHNI